MVNDETDPLVFIHGWNGSIDSWNQNINFFHENGFRCKAVELPGHGGVPEPPSNWGINDYAIKVLAQIQNEFGKQPCTLIGHSFGGRIALYLAANYPFIVRRLILSDSAGLNPGQQYSRRIIRWFSSMFASAWMNRYPIQFFVGILKRIGRITIGSKDYRNASPVMREVLKQVVDLDLKPYLSLIKQSCLIIWGEKDLTTPLSMAFLLSQGIQNSKLFIIPNCGHTPHIESALVWNQTVLNFLNASTSHHIVMPYFED